MTRLAWIVLAAWAGGLWTVCALVAPALFVLLDERAEAGRVAGALFALMSWLGLVLGALFLLARPSLGGSGRLRGDRWLAVVAALAPVLVQLGIAPAMRAARIAGDSQYFGVLHGLSAMFFAVACAATFALVWRLSHPAA